MRSLATWSSIVTGKYEKPCILGFHGVRHSFDVTLAAPAFLPFCTGGLLTSSVPCATHTSRRLPAEVLHHVHAHHGGPPRQRHHARLPEEHAAAHGRQVVDLKFCCSPALHEWVHHAAEDVVDKRRHDAA